MRYRFGDWVLDTLSYEVQRAGEPILLRPKAFQVLAYLLAHRDRVVSKHELLEQVWPGHFVEEATLNTCIMAVRKALGDSGQTPRLVHTIRGRGYRFVAPVEEGEQLSLVSQPCLAPSLSVEEVRDERHVIPHAALSVTSPMLEGELKSVTVLCCASADTPALATRLGPEAFYNLLHAWMALAQEVVQRYAGTITHSTGEDFTALFGVPAAQEDHAAEPC